MKLNKDKSIDIYRKMFLLRRFEEKCANAYGIQLIKGFCHLYIGQEAVLTGISENLTQGDATITSYRCHANAVLSGCEPKRIMAELFGRKDGVSKGKGGSMHMFNAERDFYGGQGIVGGQVSLGTGIAFAKKYNNTDNICVVFLGDGAINQGQVYESFNMASLWGLPVLYVIENNGYAMGTSVKRGASCQGKFFKRGEAFGIKGAEVDGMNVLSMIEASQDCIEYVRKQSKPFILQANTYRYRGHSMSDPATYRTKEEVEHFKSQDCIKSLEKYIIEHGYADETKLKEVKKAVNNEIKEAYDFAVQSPEPSIDELFTDILS